MKNRESGVLLPLFSLPSAYGIGTMGKEAYAFLDFLQAAGQRYWQLLPLGPEGCGDSPYQSLSVFAGNPSFIDPAQLVKEGLLSARDLQGLDYGSDPEQVDYEKVREMHEKLLRKAFEKGYRKLEPQILRFAQEECSWLEDYALFMCIRDGFGRVPFSEWPEESIRRREPAAMEFYHEKYREEKKFRYFEQYLFFRQWDALRRYARERGIRFIGDMPIYVSPDSADFWSAPELFQTDENGMPLAVAGCPPDGFAAEGQYWGNPLYDYEAMASDGYGWWIRRVGMASRLYDVIRMDHFRGFESYWSIPRGAATAAEGHWVKGPGMQLIRVLTSWFSGVEFIAEDLGEITPDLAPFLKASGLPGMNVLEFAFEAGEDSKYLPHNVECNSVCYVGTHDNDTAAGWYSGLKPEQKAYVDAYLRIGKKDAPHLEMIAAYMRTPAGLFVTTLQDVLGLGSEARINVPGQPVGNWRWRCKSSALYGKKTAKLLRHLTKTYGRLPK